MTESSLFYSTYQNNVLEIVVRSEDFIGLYDQMEVWRSEDGARYTELTGDSWGAARLPLTGGDPPTTPPAGVPLFLSGKALQVEFVGELRRVLSFEFLGLDPRSLADVATLLTVKGSPYLRAYIDSSAQLVIEALVPGQGVMMHIVPSDAASILALPLTEPESIARGHDARISLSADKSIYRFTDVFGTQNARYKTRYRSQVTGAVSDFSVPFTQGETIGVGVGALVVGLIDLVDGEGRYVVGREVSVRSSFVGTLIDGKAVVAGNDIVRKTDSTGHAEFALVRGQTYTLAIAGTDLSKEFVAPTASTIKSFQLLDPSVGTQIDYFRVRVPEIPVLERRTF